MDKLCEYSNLGDGVCDPECNNYQCGWDLGDCGYCSDGCKENLLENEKCDIECNTYECRYDNNDCGWCAEGCYIDNLEDSICQSACNNYDCNYDNYVCFGTCLECPPSYIGDNFCDDICNNADCKYDGGDCDCNAGCNILVYYEDYCRNVSGIIDDPCANLNCDYKHGVCGYCNAGCFMNNLGDGECNLACNVEACFYDFGDCGCNNGCSTTYKNGAFNYAGACENECLVPQCGYNTGKCTDSQAIQAAILNQILKQDWSAYYNPSLCNNLCDDTQSYTYTDLNKCSTSDTCNTENCLFCYGNTINTLSNCLKSDGTSCLVCNNVMIMDQCITQDINCPIGYIELDISVYFGSLKRWCFIEPTKYSMNNYKKFYVNPMKSYTQSGYYGDGSKENPMVSLYYALLSVYASYSKIILDSTVDHEFKVSPNDAISPFIDNNKDPLNTNNWYDYEELWIESDSDSVRAKVYWTSGMKISPVTMFFYIRNVEFYGTKVLKDCTEEVCLYCPYVQGSNFGFMNDRNENIHIDDYENKYGKDCDLYYSDVIFRLKNSGFFENVTFIGFRYQYSSFIYASGALTLKNVDFKKMQAKDSGSVIFLTCDLDCHSSDFYYISGIVEDIGAGYEDTEFVTTGSFFIGSGYHSATFENVQFLYNFAFSNLQASSSGSLIYSLNQIGTITISNCTFNNNYVNNLIYIDVSSLTYPDYYVEQGISTSYSQQHFQLLSSFFSNNYCSDYFIYYYMAKNTHNIQIKNVTIDNVIVGNNGIIVLNNAGNLKLSDKKGQKIKVVLDSGITKIMIPSRSVIISGLIINSGKCGGVALQISTMPNVYINDLIISNIEDGQKDDIFSIIKNFSGTGRYLSKDPPSTEVPSLNCTRITLFIDIYYLKMTNIEIFSTSCSINEGTGGLYIDSISTNLTIDNLYIHDISFSSSEAIACYIKHISKCILSHFIFNNIRNLENAVIEFYQVYTIEMTNFTGNSIQAEYSGVTLFNQINELNIKDANIIDALSHYGNGGGFWILASSQGLVLKMINVIFNRCSALTGCGAGVYLDSISTVSKILMKFQTISVINSKSIDGTVIYISAKVVFYKEYDSYISNLNAVGNSADKGGIISDLHQEGVLVLDNGYFSDNEGLHTGIYGFYSLNTPVLLVNNSMFLNSRSTEGVFSLRSFVSGTLVVFQNITMYEIEAKAIDATKVNVQVWNSSFDKIDSLVSADNNANVYFYNCLIVGVESSAVLVSKSSYFECVFCVIKYCAETIITVSDSSYINIIDSTISHNIAYSTVLIYITGKSGSLYNTLTNNIFINNTASTNGIFYFSNTQVLINSCLFKENICIYTDYNGIYSSTSNLIINHSWFYSQTSQNTGGFMHLLSSTTIIESSKFNNGTSKNGGALYVSGGSLNISNCDFWLNQANENGGSLHIDSCTTEINSSKFYQSTASQGDAIYIQGKSLKITDCEFFNSKTTSTIYSATIVTQSETKLEIYNSQFKDSLDVGGILALDTGDVFIENSFFANLNTNYYGAATFIGNNIRKSVIIKNTIFSYNNSTGNGAAIYIDSTDFEIIDSEISYNTAEVNGGGLYLVTPDCLSCRFYIRGVTTLVYNSCKKEGGAIKWLDSKPYIENTVIIENNTAEYGSNLASKATLLNFKHRNLIQSPIIGSLVDVAPGQNYDNAIEIYLYDPDGNIVKTDSSSTISVTCPSVNKLYYVSGNTTFIASEGKFTISNFVPNGPPGESMQIALTTSGITVSDSENVTNSVLIELNLRECINGEAIGSSSCDPCPSNKYLITPESSCKTCPTGAVCTGKDVIISASGYWRSNLLSEVVYACKIPLSCSGGDTTNLLGYCSTGYLGILCQSCEIGFSRDTSGKCSKCPNKGTNITILLSLLILIVFIAVVLVKTTLRTAFAAKALHSIYIKIFTNYLQLVFLTAQFNLDWPVYVLELFNVQKSAATVTEQLFSVDCYIKNGESPTSSSSYFYKIGVLACLPLAITGVSFLVWITICFINNTYSYIRRQFLTTIVVLFFLVYPNIVKVMFLNFSCISIDMKGSYLDENTEIECWSGNHMKYSLIIAMPGIIIWAIGIPTLVLIYLTKQRRFLHRDSNKIIFGFIYNGYKTTHFYWEFIIMYRKILMITVSVFMNNQSTLIQALTVVIILLGSLYLQYSKKPYCFSELNHMESEALFTATMTIYCGLYYLTDAVSEGIKMILFLFIVFGNSYFIIYWIYYMAQAIIELSLRYFPQIKFYLKRGDAFEDNFNTEDVVHQGTFFNSLEGTKNYTFMKRNDKNNYMNVPSNFEALMESVLFYELNVEKVEKNRELWTLGNENNQNKHGKLLVSEESDMGIYEDSKSFELLEFKEEEKFFHGDI
ncbi:hypothetical protein SteCoe_11895 [Stentor coeruleus]|uniref:LNR domain-containing protein n=1 Tax=Stentor coeruleus TaxID=5963 RepID=A0A1R2CC00_9CILI|nr:hypothetical protein SteCoe_11895 [Stentor coeruleus]